MDSFKKSEFLKRLNVSIGIYRLNFDGTPQAVFSNEQRIKMAIRVVTDSKLPSSPEGLDPITRAVLSIGRTRAVPCCVKDTINAMVVIEEAWEYLMNDAGAYTKFKEMNP